MATAVLMLVLMGCVGIALDVGNAWLHKRRLQSSVDLGLLAAAQKLPNAAVAATDATNYTNTNWHKSSTINLNVQTSTSCMVAGCANPDKITETATASVPTYFAKIFGTSTWTVKAGGSACGPCDSSTLKFDVIVVLDRSFSMCLDSNNNQFADGKCDDLINAVNGVKGLVPFFNPQLDQMSLEFLGPGDNVAPFEHTTAGPAYTRKNVNAVPYPCDSANPSDSFIGGHPNFYRSVGDLMDGTAANHDSWVVAPLASDFKNADGSLNNASAFMTALNCVEHKFWTPIAPAIEEAKKELAARGRAGTNKVIVYFGDGAATVTPQTRNAAGTATGAASWYTWTLGNRDKPCQDAINQAAAAKAAGIEIYTIGYDLAANGANQCSYNGTTNEADALTGVDVMQQMATVDAPGQKHYYSTAPGDVSSIFTAIGHQITSGGTRLVD